MYLFPIKNILYTLNIKQATEAYFNQKHMHIRKEKNTFIVLRKAVFSLLQYMTVETKIGFLPALNKIAITFLAVGVAAERPQFQRLLCIPKLHYVSNEIALTMTA